MIVLDTNVLSELMKHRPSPEVLAWVMRQPRRELLTTSVSQAELYYGLALLPEGRRKAALVAGAGRLFNDVFAGQILPFDGAAAIDYGEIRAMRRRAGRPIAALDAQIAAVARSVGADLATRNLNDFEGCGLELINPWSAN